MEFWIRGRKKILNDLRPNLFQNYRKNVLTFFDFMSHLLYKFLLNFEKTLQQKQWTNMAILRNDKRIGHVFVNQQVCQRKYKTKTLYVEGYRLNSIGASIHSGGKNEIKSKAYGATSSSVLYLI